MNNYKVTHEGKHKFIKGTHLKNCLVTGKTTIVKHYMAVAVIPAGALIQIFNFKKVNHEE